MPDPKSSPGAPDPRLMLITPPLADDSRGAALAALVAGGRVASVLLDLAPADERALQRLAQGYAQIAQGAGAAALAPAGLDTRIVGRAGLDGVHVSGLDGLGAALSAMRPDKVVGVGALALRDDAMTAGEEEPDYILFGEPAADGFVRPLDWRIERIAWWAEIFNVPGAAYVAERGDVTPLVEAGADFLCFGPWVFEASDGPAILDAAQAALDAKTARDQQAARDSKTAAKTAAKTASKTASKTPAKKDAPA